MADIEKFVLKIEVDGDAAIDSLIKSIDDVDKKIKAVSGKTISISGDSKAIKALSTELDNLGKKVKEINNQKISIDTGGDSGGISGANGALSSLMTNMGGLAGPAQIAATAILALGAAGTAAAIGLADTSREISNFAAISGTDTDTFQRMAAGAKSVGIESDKLADIYKDVNDKVGDFMQTGGGEMKDFFENIAPKVGVTADEFRNLSGPDALQLYASTLQKAGANQQDVTLYMESLADEASALYPLLQDNGKGMKELGDRAAELGGIIDKDTIRQSKELKTAMDDLGTAMTALANDFGSALTPMMTAMAEWAAQAITNFRKVWKEASLFKQNLAGAMDSSFVEGQGAYDTSVQDAMLEQERDAAAKAAARAKAAAQRKGVGETWVAAPTPKATKAAGGGGGRSKAASDAEKIAKEAERERDAMIKSAKAAEDMVISMRLNNESRLNAIDLESSILGKTKEEADQIKATAKLRKDEADAILKLETAIKDEMAKAKPNLVAVETFKTGIADVKKSTDAIVTAQDAYNDKLKKSIESADALKRVVSDYERILSNSQTLNIANKQASGQLYGRNLEDAKKRLEIEKEVKKEVEAGLKLPPLPPEKAIPLSGNEKTDKFFIGTEIAAEQRAIEVERRLQEINAADEIVRNSMTAGWNDAWSSMAESMTPFNLAAKAANDLWGNISSSIDTAVETGKFKFADFRDSVIKDIAKMMAKAAASKLIGTLLGTATSVVTGAVTGGLTGGLTGGNAAQGLQLPRAKGGSVGGGNPYLVGERGPELFMPGQNGTIIPNRNLEDTKPQVVNNYTYNVSAVDGQSVARFFMENKNMVAAANRQATKERS